MKCISEKYKLYWFVLGIMLSLVLAQIRPDIGQLGGPLYPELTVKYGAVAVIYFLTVWGFTCLLQRLGMDEWILKGLVIMSTMPPPISSAAIMTRAIGGNEAAAVINSALGSFLGVFFTPAALLLFLGSATLIPVRSAVVQLVASVIFPFLLGQSVRASEMVRASDLPISLVSLTSLLLILFSTFCDVFSGQDSSADPIDLLLTVLLAIFIQLLSMFLSWNISGFMGRFSVSDRTAIMFVCTHKSLTLGLPILKIIFAGYSHFTSVSLPLLIYHPSQMILAIFLVTEMKPFLQVPRQSQAV